MIDAIANAMIYINLALAAIIAILFGHSAIKARPAYRLMNVMFSTNAWIMVGLYIWLIASPDSQPYWAGRLNLFLMMITLLVAALEECDRVGRASRK